MNEVGMVEKVMEGVLVYLSGYDLVRKELPCIGLLFLSACSVAAFFGVSGWEQLTRGLTAISMLGIGAYFQRKKEALGSGDVWVLSVIALGWPLRVWGQSLSIGLSIMALVSLGCWWLEKSENIRIPFVPFLLLGYWMRGTVYGI